jgi:putative restriction endonuclease
MKLFVGITDYDWFQLLASRPELDEVNFWRPSPEATFKVLQPGELFLFKLHAPRHVIVGGGLFARFVQLPLSLAWAAFGEKNGAVTLDEVRARIGRYRRQHIGPRDDPAIGCILLEEPFFFEERDWIPVPRDFSGNIVVGKSYDIAAGDGLNLWLAVGERLARQTLPGPGATMVAEMARYGRPAAVTPRLGQGSFRVMVTDAYRRRCAMTGERTLPVLQAAHIRPYSTGGEHALSNGLLLRSDVHTLFDLGYMTVDPDERRIVVSQRIREEFENGRQYYELHGRPITVPPDPRDLPSRENLLYHAQTVFR